jgi:hypothetical protein
MDELLKRVRASPAGLAAPGVLDELCSVLTAAPPVEPDK